MKSSCFGPSSIAMVATPVTFPPGSAPGSQPSRPTRVQRQPRLSGWARLAARIARAANRPSASTTSTRSRAIVFRQRREPLATFGEMELELDVAPFLVP